MSDIFEVNVTQIQQTLSANLGDPALEEQINNAVDAHASETDGVHGISVFGASLVGSADAGAAKAILELDALVIDDSNYGKLDAENAWAEPNAFNDVVAFHGGTEFNGVYIYYNGGCIFGYSQDSLAAQKSALGITGTGVVAALANPVNAAGGFVTFSGNIGNATGSSLNVGVGSVNAGSVYSSSLNGDSAILGALNANTGNFNSYVEIGGTLNAYGQSYFTDHADFSSTAYFDGAVTCDSTITATGFLINGAEMVGSSGGLVRSTSPTLVTPVLGVATATSITYSGGGSITGASGAVTIAASGTNQSVILNPTGSGFAQVNGQAKVLVNLTGGDGFVVQNTNSAGPAAIAVGNNNDHRASMFKCGSTQAVYKTIGPNVLGFYNGFSGNMALLNDFASGNITLTAGASSTAHVTINTDGSVVSAGKITVTAGQIIFGADSGLSRTGSASFALGNASAGNAVGSLALSSLTASAGITGKNLTLAAPSSSITPTNNGDLVVEATSNTNVNVKYKGSDGLVRAASLPLLRTPTVSFFSTGWVNQGGRTATDVTTGAMPGLLIKGPTGGTGLGMLLKPLSVAGTWSYRARVNIWLPATNYVNAGLVLRDSASGKLKTFGMRHDAVYTTQYLKWDSATVFNTIASTRNVPNIFDWDFRLTYNGTNIIFEISANQGVSWTTVSTEAVATFTTQNQVGIYLDTQFNEVHMLVTDWEET